MLCSILVRFHLFTLARMPVGEQTIGGYNPLRSSPVAFGDMVYVVAWDGLHAVRRTDGVRLWHYFIKLVE